MSRPPVPPGTPPGAPAGAGARPAQPQVRLDTSELKSSYCNVCNATVTPEEVVLNFGLNQSWDRQDGDYLVSLQHRIILSPFAARRLYQILGELLAKDARPGGSAGPGDGSA